MAWLSSVISNYECEIYLLIPLFFLIAILCKQTSVAPNDDFIINEITIKIIFLEEVLFLCGQKTLTEWKMALLDVTGVYIGY